MIKLIHSKMYLFIERLLYKKIHKKSMHKMMSHYLKTKPNKVHAIYKLEG